MKLAYPQLTPHLAKQLAPIYLISGDEHLLVQEAVTAIRDAAYKAGFHERVSITPETKGDFAKSLYTDAHSRSLFSSKKIIELNLRLHKLTATQGKIFEEYANNPLADTILIISTTKLDAPLEKTAWYKAIEKNGMTLPIWPIATAQLPQWILQRAKKLNLQLTQEAALRLATLVEGNLLAAATEIEKLSLLYPNKTVSVDAIENVVMDNARFDIFNLADSALQGNASRCMRILKNLSDEGIEPTLILWSLTREIRVVADIQHQLQQGESLPALFAKAKIWEKRQAGFKSFLQRHTQNQCWDLLLNAAKIDRMIKGIDAGNVWDELETFLIQMSSSIPRMNPI